MDTAQQRLRVMIVSHLFPLDDHSTYGIFVREQAEALSRLMDVTVLVGRYGLAARTERLSQPGMRVIEVPLPGFGRLPSPLAVMRSLRPYARHIRAIAGQGPERFDIIHAHFGFPDGYLAVRHGVRESVPTVVTLHGDDFNRQFARPVIGPLFARTLSHADRLIGVNPRMTSELQRMTGASQDRIAFVPNGYNNREIRPHPQREPKYFLCVGGLNERKNPEMLVRAFACVSDRMPYDLVFVGDGPMRDRLSAVIVELGLEHRVRLEGHQEHSRLDSYLAETAALVLPSLSEGMPIVVNEALGSGTPVIASRLPGTAHQVREDRFGILIEPGDVAALADALITAANTQWDYAAIAAESGVASWDDYAQTLAEMYHAVITGKPGSSAR